MNKNFVSKKIKFLSNHGGDIRKVFMLGQKLKAENPNLKLIDLSLGNPDVDSPDEVSQGLLHLANLKENSSHRYMDAAGLPEIREFIANKLTILDKVDIDKNSVYLTVGAAGGLQILLRTFLDDQDEVIIFSPYFPEYIPYLLNINCKPIICSSDKNHLPNLDSFSKLISKKTKAVIINSPNNPSGALYDVTILNKISCILLEQYNKTGQIIHVISDEPYSRMTYENVQFSSILQHYPFSWVVRSFSKDLCLAGERIGYIAWRREIEKLIPNISDVFRNTSRILGYVSAPRLMQRLIPFIFEARANISIYEERMKAFSNILVKNNIELVIPKAGFFAFPKCPIEDDRLFCSELVNFGILCVPGSGFGSPGYFRASLTQPIDNIHLAALNIVQCKEFFHSKFK
jgi:aspartate aminotransferase